MGIYDRPYYQNDANPNGLQLKVPQTMVGKLILLNGVSFAVILLFGAAEWLSVSAGDAVRPWYWWRFLTYGFAHDPSNWRHIIFNMLMLYMFGREVESLYGSRRFLHAYLAAVVLGGIIWTFSVYWVMTRSGLDPLHFHLLGASGAVMAILVLFCLHFPNRQLYVMMVLPVPAWVVGIALVIFDLAGYVSPSHGGNQVAYLVHLVGAATGGLYFLWGERLDRVLAPIIGGLQSLGTSRRLKVYRGSEDIDRLAKEADRILEKLHRDGEASLTGRERRILESYSRQMRDKRR